MCVFFSPYFVRILFLFSAAGHSLHSALNKCKCDSMIWKWFCVCARMHNNNCEKFHCQIWKNGKACRMITVECIDVWIHINHWSLYWMYFRTNGAFSGSHNQIKFHVLIFLFNRMPNSSSLALSIIMSIGSWNHFSSRNFQTVEQHVRMLFSVITTTPIVREKMFHCWRNRSAYRAWHNQSYSLSNFPHFGNVRYQFKHDYSPVFGCLLLVSDLFVQSNVAYHRKQYRFVGFVHESVNKKPFSVYQKFNLTKSVFS